MELKLLENINSIEWDKIISQFNSKGLYHQSAWLDFIEKTQRGKKVILEIKENDKTLGYFAGFIVKKGPFKILGSPLIGWATEFLGPVVNEDFNQRGFLAALEEYCKLQKIDHLELSNPILNPEIMRDFGFQCKEGRTFIIDLSPDEKIMWRNLKKKSCRYPIHKALKHNLKVEDTDNPKIVDDFHNQLQEVFAKQKLVPTFSRFKIQTLFNCLKKQDLLFALEVKYNDKVIATGFFPHDDRWVYFWGGASWLKFRHLYPNELIHWTAMLLAAKSGISKYNMGGGGAFKSKFGGKLTSTYHWYKSYNPLAGVARQIYQCQFRILQKINGIVKNKLLKV